MKISLIIPLYNKELQIEKCLRSVKSQTKPVDEIIIINDGSTDESLKKVQDFKINHQLDNLLIVNQYNHGVSYTRNKGIYLAKNEFLAFLDADDEWDKDFVKEMTALANDFPEAAIYSCYHYINKGNTRINLDNNFPNDFRGYLKNYFKDSKNRYLVTSSSIIAKKDTLIEVGLFPLEGKVSEDLFLWFQIIKKNKISFLNKPLVTINQIEDDSRNARIGEIPYLVKYYKDNITLFHKLNHYQKEYIFNIHRNHILSSLSYGRYDEAKKRIKYGFKLFKYRSFALTFLCKIPKKIFIYLKEARTLILIKK